MTIQTQTAAVLDMWYGRRQDWYDDELPDEMNEQLSNPAYRDHDALSYIEEFGAQPVSMDWIESDRERIALGVGL